MPHSLVSDLKKDKNYEFAVHSIVNGYLTDYRDDGSVDLIFPHVDDYNSRIESLMAVHNIGKRMAKKVYNVAHEIFDWTLRQQDFYREQKYLARQTNRTFN